VVKAFSCNKFKQRKLLEPERSCGVVMGGGKVEKLIGEKWEARAQKVVTKQKTKLPSFLKPS
jgi:hypothetical protein